MNPLNKWLDQDHQIFMLAAELGSISAAARKLGKDLGNLSRALSRLENLHGEALFVRHQTGLALTSAGNELLRALQSSKEAYERTLSSKVSTSIRIGFSPPIGFSFFCENFFPLLTTLRLSPTFKLQSSLELFELIKRRELDLILAPRSPQFPGIISSPLFSTKLALCSRTGKKTNRLIRSEFLFDLEKHVQGLRFDETLIMNDYFVAAKLLVHSDEYMGILPEGILPNFPELKVLDHPFFNEKVYAITWKGSPGVRLLQKVKEDLRS